MKYKYIILITSAIILVLFLTYVFMPPQIHIKNEEANVKTKYTPNYKVTKLGIDYTNKTKIKNNINYKKLGTYSLIFNTQIGHKKYTQIKKIKVVDKEFPAIVLNGNDTTYVCPKTKYNDEKASAFDNYDGNITKKIKTTVEKEKIIYTVKDSSNNKSKKERKLIYEDITKPKLTLKGESTVTIYQGDKYNEPGVLANDNCDGDISNKIVTSGSVDSSKLGTYTLTYSVLDSHNNSADITRTVKVIAKQTEKGGTIYLTFDDGPLEGTTNIILDILKEEGVKATFFVTKNGPDYLIKREYDEGHTVALHTWSHDYKTCYSSVENYFNDLKNISDRVKNITGVESKIIRFPGGSSNTVSRNYAAGIMSTLTTEVANRGYAYFDWNISSGDAGQTTDPNAIYGNVTRNLNRNRANIVLMHDIKTYTRDALRNIIKYGKENGYTFDKITESTAAFHQKVNN